MSAGRIRLLKFLMVGAIGVVVQLGALAAFTQMQVTYLTATGLAVECAVLHNFLWHWRYTWSDRAQSGINGFLFALLRFHVSNGLISIAGNLLLMRMLVGSLRVRVLPANTMAIVVCFAVNFLASDRWVFRKPVVRTNGKLSHLGHTVAHENQRTLRERDIGQRCGNS